MSRAFRGLFLALLLSLSASLHARDAHGDPSGPALDDRPPPPGGRVYLDETVITGRMASPDLQDVPASVTSLSGTFIENSGTTNLFAASQYLPNVQINPVLDARTTAIRIRGIGSDGFNAGIDPSVGVYIDGIYQGRTAAAAIADLVDTDRLDVLRGPQGTSFGKNLPAGALSIVTTAPALDRWEGFIEGVAGNFADKEVRGAINAPVLKERVALRLSGYWLQHDPYDENLAGGAGRNDGDRNGFRLKSLARITDDLDLTLTGDYGTEQTTCCVADIATYAGVPNLDVTFADLARVTGRPLPEADPFDRLIDANESTKNDLRVWGLSGQLDYRWSRHLLTWVNAYRHLDLNSVIDADFSSYDAVFQNTHERFDQVSSELRLTSPQDDDLDYIAGLYLYYQEDDTRGVLGIGPDWFQASSVGPLLLSQGGADEHGRVFNTDTNTHDTQSYAFYGQGTYHLGPRWALTAGLRATYERKTRVGSQIAGFTAIDAGPFGPDRHADQSRSRFNLSPMAVAQFTLTPDVGLFARIAQGFKSGGFNQLRTAKDIPSEFDDEEATDAELGWRSIWLDGRLLLNATAFYTWYKNFQATVFDGSSFSVSSAKRVLSYGVEGDVLVVLVPNLVAGAAVGYNRAEYDSFPNARCTAEEAYAHRVDSGTVPIPTTCTQDLSGRPLDNAPQWSIATYVEGTHNAGSIPWLELPLQAFLRAEYSFRDQIYLQQDLDENLKEPPVNLVNLRGGARTRDDAWELTLWVRNLGNVGYAAAGFDVPILSGFAVVNAPPRTFGATLRYRF